MQKLFALTILTSLLICSSCEDPVPLTVEQIVLSTAEEKPGVDIIIGALTDTLSEAHLGMSSEISLPGEILKSVEFELTDSSSAFTSYVPLQLTRIYEKGGCECTVTEFYSIIPSGSEIRKTVQINCHNK